MKLKPSSATGWTPPGIGIGKLLRRAHMAFSRVFRERLAACEMTFGEFIHLERLWDEDGLNQTELSRRVGIATASSTQIIETLEKRGLIYRKRNRGDRRNINVFLTDDGKSRKDELLACAKSTNRDARMGLNAAEVQALFSTGERIIANLENVAGKRASERSRSRAKQPNSRRSSAMSAED